MANLTDLKRGNAYSFSFYASRIWPNNDGVVFDGTIGYTTASGMDAVANRHAAALGYLPEGTTTDPTRLNYVVFLVNGLPKVYAWEWINSTTIKETAVNTRTVVLSGATAANDQAIRMAMQSIGMKVASIS